ncbi:hypothetical protein [Streptomyces sp. ME19-01-6]|uniref:hypothetical protein n=1 Tax=Streptomyces sp. ME19-01-6 TaxID=3028686 RepID=UPI0029AFDFAC|nr:hypothetical protein [Streptomyces sp. ME19-01-6]MDX3233527.1 hypothetical protein [Streptomyces sp. ME19-01-6]
MSVEPKAEGHAMGARLPAKLTAHPSCRPCRRGARRENRTPSPVIDASWLRDLCLAAGADDAAAVSLDHPDLAGEREHARSALPGARTLVSLVFRMNRDYREFMSGFTE